MINVYAVKDNVSGRFHDPILQVNDATVVRLVKTQMEMDKNLMSLNPTDFSIYKIGTYDELTGTLTGCVDFLVNVSDLVKVV